ncbi:NAD-dependent epimerase/dehydratase family protein [Streptosporangium sp. NPDC000396]|uniref:NAD-dependent epimerase/dehydratase family protein n=1 Tax=Streptosporangium sp. NPDC000396 TaxID=3366185 RepID=UPI0036A95C29
MGKHVVIGSGQVGAKVARLLLDQGHEVVVVTRSGSGPDGVRKVAANAADAEALTREARGADAIYNCVNPRYHEWARDWPPISASLLTSAEATGAVLVMLGNLYGYGPIDGPITEDAPLAATGTKGRVRAKMWTDALAAHQSGRIRVTELRGSDYYGPGALDQSYLGDRFVPKLLAGKAAQFPGDPDMPHSWTYLTDAARALVTAATDERAWGRAWHIPTAPAVSARAVAARIAELAGTAAPRITRVPDWVMKIMGLAVPLMRELGETRYQFNLPFVLDSSAFETTFGLAPTPLDEGLKETIGWWREQAATRG